MILPYQLRIGVMGHRNLAEGSVSRSEQAVARWLAIVVGMSREAGARPFMSCSTVDLGRSLACRELH